jgi:hypothetical protein
VLLFCSSGGGIDERWSCGPAHKVNNKVS